MTQDKIQPCQLLITYSHSDSLGDHQSSHPGQGGARSTSTSARVEFSASGPLPELRHKTKVAQPGVRTKRRKQGRDGPAERMGCLSWSWTSGEQKRGGGLSLVCDGSEDCISQGPGSVGSTSSFQSCHSYKEKLLNFIITDLGSLGLRLG